VSRGSVHLAALNPADAGKQVQRHSSGSQGDLTQGEAADTGAK